MGAATAKLFADQGAKVAALDLNEASVAGVVQEITAAGKSAKAWQIDLADGDAIIRVMSEIAEHFGGIDLLVNNAGISIPAPIDRDGYDAAWDQFPRCVTDGPAASHSGRTAPSAPVR